MSPIPVKWGVTSNNVTLQKFGVFHEIHLYLMKFFVSGDQENVSIAIFRNTTILSSFLLTGYEVENNTHFGIRLKE